MFRGKVEFINYNNLTTLNNRDIEYTEFWTPTIQGAFGEPCKCYTYQPRAQRKTGFRFMVTKK